LAAAVAAVKVLRRHDEGPVAQAIALRVLPADATLRLDSVTPDAETVLLLPGTTHVLRADARGHLTTERLFEGAGPVTIELRLAHALPRLDDDAGAADVVAPPAVAAGAAPAAWADVDAALRRLDLYAECLARPGAGECA